MSRQRGPRTGTTRRGGLVVPAFSRYSTRFGQNSAERGGDVPLSLEDNPQRHVVRRTRLSELAQRGLSIGKGDAFDGIRRG